MKYGGVKTKYRQIRADFSLKKDLLYQQLWELEPHSATNDIPLTWNKAINFSVYDDLGNKWIDMTSGIFVANAGHANPVIKAAIQKQLDSNLLFSYNYPTAIRQKFLAKLLAISPHYFDKALLLNSGSEAVGAAYKLIKLWAKRNNRKYLISFTGNYHGQGLSNDLICGDKNKASWSNVSDDDVVFLDFPYIPTDRFNPDKLPPANQIAAFFLETFQGWSAWFYPQNFIRDLNSFARNAGALICFDEMQSGFYRLGPLYGYMTYGNIRPDIICLGKGVSSSLPISAVLSRKEIIDDENADLHGTHSGNPLCCAAALANIDFLSDTKRIQKREKVIKLFETKLSRLEKLSSVVKVNVRGLIAGIIFKNTATTTNVVLECIKQGVLPVYTSKHSIKLAPPLTITVAAVNEAINVISNCIKNVEKNQS